MTCARACSRTRPRRRRPIVLGLTGSVGMGKSTAAAMLRRLGVPVHDADAAVHAMMTRGGSAVPAIAQEFPDVIVDGAVDRKALGRRVFHDTAALRRLEAILHPRTRAAAHRFIQRHRRARTPVVVLDIPLLFETGGERLCDAVAVVSAPQFVQMARVLRRPGMTRATLDRIRDQQMPDARKRRLADFVVETGLGKGPTLRRLRQILKILRENPPERPRARRTSRA